ncbi:MAG: KamA family protein [Bacteroidales bacterium]|nr:KamA family protein [Bacteroidales bacterium]
MSFKENSRLYGPSSQIKNLVEEIYLNCPQLRVIMRSATHYEEAFLQIEELISNKFQQNERVKAFYNQKSNQQVFDQLQWSDFALIRLWDYVRFSDQKFPFHGEPNGEAHNHPFHILWLTDRENKAVATEDFFVDMRELLKQWNDKSHRPTISLDKTKGWMSRHYSGLDDDVQSLHRNSKDRIIRVLVREIDKQGPQSKYHFSSSATFDQKLSKVYSWWNDFHFHLKFAIRKPELLNEMLDYSLSEKTMQLFSEAQKKGIPFFVNPYYLSLILVDAPKEMKSADQTLRDYIFYSRDLVEEFGQISAWEKEDIVEEGKPNAAGWILPNNHNIHRRYPEVAIFIPDSMGRACGGLCVSCQRMYDFQRGNLNFNLDKLKPKETWNEKLQKLMQYFEFDSHLKDILITGGDSLMSSTPTIKKILDAVYEMAVRKKEANKTRPIEEKYAEMQRIRLGTRLPVYLPQRIDNELVEVLADFKLKAQKIGFLEFVVQVHFESPMEITPESKKALLMLNKSGWLLVNQQVFTVAASRRGYSSRLRQMLNSLGVITYYTFSVKGFKENRHNFATNARAAQEMAEEKIFGKLPVGINLKKRIFQSTDSKDKVVREIMNDFKLPFLSTDRNVFNMPAVGKSMTYRVIGITADGRRILMFDYDHTRKHSPIVKSTDKVVLVESKSIATYLNQLEQMGENRDEYRSIYGYSMALTERRSDIFEYPKSKLYVSKKYSNIKL